MNQSSAQRESQRSHHDLVHELHAARERAELAEASVAELRASLECELDSMRRVTSRLRLEYSHAAVRNKRIEARLIALLQRLLGGEAAPILLELVSPTLEVAELANERERHLLHLLEVDEVGC